MVSKTDDVSLLLAPIHPDTQRLLDYIAKEHDAPMSEVTAGYEIFKTRLSGRYVGEGPRMELAIALHVGSTYLTSEAKAKTQVLSFTVGALFGVSVSLLVAALAVYS